jgi:cytochrome c-type biogenesis protein CcmH/NrfG
MGRLQLAKGRWQRSAELLTRCVMQDPRYPQAWFSLGEAYRAGGNLTEAANAYRKQIELVPGHSEAVRALAEVERKLARRSP